MHTIITIIAIVSILLSIIYDVKMYRKPDGHMLIDETQDLWSVAISTPPETVKHKRYIILKVDTVR